MDFFTELRRVVDAAGLTTRELERRTSAAREGAVAPAFYSKSQWSRWLNGQAVPPRRAVQRLADVLRADGVDAGPLLALHQRTMIPVQRAGGKGDGERDAEEQGDTGQPPRQVPSVTPDFTGRTRELAELDRVTGEAREGRNAVVVVTGTAGVGKTTLANYFCQRVAPRFPDGQLYVNLRGFDPGGKPLDPAAALRGFIEALGAKLEPVRDDLDATAARYRTLLAGRRVLIILDNALGEEQVRPLIPGSPGCLTVVTSRNDLIGLLAQGARLLRIPLFTTADAGEFLTRRLGAARVTREREAAAEFIRRCAGLPLALSVAAAHAAAHPGDPLADLAGELSSRTLDQLETGDEETSARSVFSWSYDDLPERERRMFRLLGVDPGPDIGVLAAASLAALPADQAAAALRELARTHLVEEHAEGRFTMHDLLRAYAAELAMAVDGQDAVDAAELRLLDHYLHTGHAAALLFNPATDCGDITPLAVGAVIDPPGTGDEAMAWYTAESAALLAACARTAERDLAPYNWQLPWVIAQYLVRRVRWAESAATQRAAAASAERAGDLRGLGYARYLLAQALDLSGNGADAEQQLLQARDAFRAVGDGAGQGMVLFGMSQVLRGQDRYEEALPIARESLRLRTEHGTPAAVAISADMLGAICAHLGRHAEAVAYCERALRISEAAGFRSYQAEALGHLGMAHARAGNYVAAVSSYRQAVEVWRAISGMADVAVTLSELASVEEATGDLANASRDRAAAEDILSGMPPVEAEQVRAWITRDSALPRAPDPPPPDSGPTADG